MTIETFDSSRGQLWARVLGIGAAVLLGLVFLVAAWAKALDPVSFVEQIRAERLDFFGLAEAAAFMALGLEIALGLALVTGLRRWWVLAPTAALVAFFLFLTGRAYWRFEHGLIDETEAHCGCFGNLLNRTPKEAFWQDLWLLVVPLGLSLVGRGNEAAFPKRRLMLIGALTAAALVFAWKAEPASRRSGNPIETRSRSQRALRRQRRESGAALFGRPGERLERREELGGSFRSRRTDFPGSGATAQ